MHTSAWLECFFHVVEYVGGFQKCEHWSCNNISFKRGWAEAPLINSMLWVGQKLRKRIGGCVHIEDILHNIAKTHTYMPMAAVLVEVKVMPWFRRGMILKQCPVVLNDKLTVPSQGICSLPTYRPGWGVLIRFHILRQESRWRPKVGETKEWRLETEADKLVWDDSWVVNWVRWIENGELRMVNWGRRARGWL